MRDITPVTDSWRRFSTANTAYIILKLNLCLKFWSLLDTYIDLSTIYADAPNEMKSLAQEDRLQIPKTLDAQTAPDANHAKVLELSDVQDPHNKPELPRSEQALAAKRHGVSQGALQAGMPNIEWVFHSGTEDKHAHNHEPYQQFVSSR